MADLPGTACHRASPFYQSVPLGGLSQPNYVNAVAGFLTTSSAAELLAQLLQLEASLGRVRDAVRWAPRRIDLDLLVFGAQRIDVPGLTVPHPGIVSRNFVLYPLVDVAPGLEIPGLGPASRLRAAVGTAGLQRMT